MRKCPLSLFLQDVAAVAAVMIVKLIFDIIYDYLIDFVIAALSTEHFAGGRPSGDVYGS